MAVCYRHPDRETGVSCSNCGNPICPDCMTATPVGMRCPECSRQRTQVRTMRDMHADPTVAYVLLAVNVLMYFGQTASPSNSVYRDFVLYGPLVADGEWWRLLTAGFLHGGLFHLLLNMYALYFLGRMLEPALGHVRFAALYFASLLAGSFGAVLLSPETPRSEEHTSELQSPDHLVCRLLLEKKKKKKEIITFYKKKRKTTKKIM